MAPRQFAAALLPFSFPSHAATMSIAPSVRPPSALRLRALLRPLALQRCQSTAVAIHPSANATVLCAHLFAPPKKQEVVERRPIKGGHLFQRGQKHFIVAPRVQPALRPVLGIVPSFEALELAKLDPSGARREMVQRTSKSAARVGDVLLVTRRDGEPFAGVLMQLRHRNIDTAILLRGRLSGVGVEMWFKVFSPRVSGIDIVWRRPKRARRNRLTYLRQPKHDVGSVERHVLTWRKEMKLLKGKGRTDGSVETRFDKPRP